MRLSAPEQAERVTWSLKSWSRLNFVTATLEQQTQDHKVISQAWYSWIKLLRRRFPRLRVIRVLQKHEGGHGWHIHAFFDQYIPAQIAWSLARQAGLGRIDLKMVSGQGREKSIRYVVRYLVRDANAARGTRIRMITASGNLRSACKWWLRYVDLTLETSISKLRKSLILILETNGLRIPSNSAFFDLLRGSPPWAVQRLATLHPGLAA